MPVIVLVLVIFALVVVATAKKVHLGLAAALGGLAFALARGRPVLDVLRAALAEALSADTLLLLGIMAGIMAFSRAMKNAGAMDRLSLALVQAAPSQRVALAAAPLLIGTLPMPGGAIMSAPLVDAMDPERSLGGARLSATNYWFRHNLELAWPLYPAFNLTSSLSGIATGRLMLLNAYAFPVLFALGLIFILPKTSLPPVERRKGGLSALAAGLAPLAMVLAVYAALDMVLRSVLPGLVASASLRALVQRYLPIGLGLAAGCAWLLSRTPRGDARKGLFKGALNAGTVKLLAVIMGIRVFSALLGAAGAATDSAAELAAWGIPGLVAVALLPFVAGLVTGVGFGYVGLAFPIILGLIPSGFPLEAGVVLAGAFGYAGMMLSPLHVCMVVSAEHFGAGLAGTIRRFALPLAAFVAVGSAYAFVLSTVLR